MVPVPAQLGGGAGNDDEVAGPFGDVLVASRTEVGLAGLIGLDPPYLEFFSGQVVIHRPPVRRG